MTKPFGVFYRSRWFFLAFPAAAILAGFWSLAGLRAEAANVREFYVSPTGADANPGTKSRPFLTLARARDSVRLINRQMKGDIVVYLRGGTYALTNTLTFLPEDSANNGYKIICQSYKSETPIISGGKIVTGWTLRDETKNIWQASVAAGDNFRQLYVNGVKAIRARSTSAEGLSTTAEGYQTTNKSLQNFGNITNMEVVTNPEPWQQDRLPIAAIQGTNITLQQPCWPAVKKLKFPGYAKPTRLENAYEFLGEAGSWYLDRSTHTLFYVPRPGEQMATATVEAPVVEQLITLSGTAANPVSNLGFAGLTLRLSNWLAPGTGRGLVSDQANQGVPVLAAFDCTGAHNITVTACRFEQLGGDGINFLKASRNDTVADCTFHEIAASALQIGELDGSLPANSGDYVAGITVSNCTIHEVCGDYQAGCGIFLGWTADCTIAHNEIYDLPYTAISLGWGWTKRVTAYAGGNQILGNRIHDHMRVLVDGGGIYCNGFQKNGLVSGNYIYNQGNVYGEIYLDDGAANWTVVSNVCKKSSSYAWYHYKGSNNHAAGNFTDNGAVLNQTTGPLPSTVTNTTVITNGDWPPAALAIMNAAGPVGPGRRKN